MKKRKKKQSFNLAISLMVMTTICLSFIQFGFSFLSQRMFLGGIGEIKSSLSSSGAVDMVTSSNADFVIQDFSNDPTTDAVNLGYETILRGSVDDTLNNYLKFSPDATELWRIVGWTQDGIKIVKDEFISAENEECWDIDEAHWVGLDSDQSFPYQQQVTSFTGACTMCVYLNTTYYASITDVSSINYINPIYINHEATWDITPMNVQSGTPEYVGNMQSGYLTAKAVVSPSFVGLPIGLLSVTERCLLSSSFTTTNESMLYESLFDGWMNANVDNEMTLTERVQDRDMETNNTTFSTSQALFTQDTKISNSNKASNGRDYRPAMVLYKDVQLADGGGTGVVGSMTNPFIVTGRGA